MLSPSKPILAKPSEKATATAIYPFTDSGDSTFAPHRDTAVQEPIIMALRITDLESDK